MLPGLNLLVRRLLSAVPQMANVIVLTAFVVTAFAVIGLQLFCDEMPGVCSVSGEVCKPRSRFVEHAPETCPPGAGACTRTTTYDGAYVGINTFDTMFWSLLTVFTCITMEASRARGERWACPPRRAGGAPEQRHRPRPRCAPRAQGWSDVMYAAMAGTHWLAALYFVPLTLIGGYLIVQLFLGVIYDAFTGARAPLARPR